MENIVVDENALKADVLAGVSRPSGLGWTSGKITEFLSNKGIITSFNFEPLKEIFQQNPAISILVKRKLAEALNEPDIAKLYDRLNRMDTTLQSYATQFFSLSDSAHEGKSANHFSCSGMALLNGNDPNPIWLKREEVIRNIFIGSDFKLLPERADLTENDLKRFDNAMETVNSVQYEHAKDLASGKVDYTSYQRGIRENPRHYEADKIIDEILSKPDENCRGMTFKEKLNELWAARQKCLPAFQKLVSDSDFDNEEFQCELKYKVYDQSREILDLRSKRVSRLEFMIRTRRIIRDDISSTPVNSSLREPYSKMEHDLTDLCDAIFKEYLSQIRKPELELGAIKLYLNSQFKG
jgi:hypothetical protein